MDGITDALGKTATKVPIGDKQYQVHELTLNDIASFVQHFRDKELSDLYRIAREQNLPKDMICQMTIDARNNKKPDQQILEEYSETMEGIQYFVYLALRRDGVTLEQVREFDNQDIEVIEAVINSMIPETAQPGNESDSKKND